MATQNHHPLIAILHPEGEMPPGLDPLKGEAELRFATGGRELCEILGSAEVLMVTDFRSDALADAWPQARGLKWIHAMSAGVDKVLIPGVVEGDVTVTNARGVFDRGIAEYVLGAVLFFAKDFGGNLRFQAARQWKHRETARIDGATLLIVGAGSIGGEIGRLARAAGMRVVGVSGRGRADDPDLGRVHPAAALMDLLPEADYVAIATPLTEKTYHLFDARAFAAMKPGACLINIGRGPVVDTDALMQVLKSGRLKGAALDVFEEEPLPADHPLWSFENVMMSAHMAGDFFGWEEALTRQFIENFRRWVRGEPLFNVVDKKRGYGSS